MGLIRIKTNLTFHLRCLTISLSCLVTGFKEKNRSHTIELLLFPGSSNRQTIMRLSYRNLQNTHLLIVKVSDIFGLNGMLPVCFGSPLTTGPYLAGGGGQLPPPPVIVGESALFASRCPFSDAKIIIISKVPF